MKKILQINTQPGWRGGERQTLYTVAGLQAAGQPTELLCRAGGELERRAQAEGLVTHGVSSHWGAMRWLMRHGHGYGLIHSQASKDQTASLLAWPLHRRPLVYTRRVDFVPKPGFSRWKYHRMDRVVAISPAIQRILQGIGLGDVPVIPSAVRPVQQDASRAAQYVAQLGFGGRRILGTTAALVPHKDPLTAVRAFARLHAQLPDVGFLHFGEGPLRPQVEAEIRRLGLEGAYHLGGYVRQVEDFFTVLDGFVMSSVEEGLGSSLLDAFLYRVPVVATRAGGMEELVAGVGYQAPVQDPDALAAAMQALLTDSAQTEEYVAAAQARVLALHSVEQVTRQYLALYRTLV